MIYRRRRSHSTAPSGFYRFENMKSRANMVGYGEGDFVRLRDEYGTVWNGMADSQGDNIVRYRFRDASGKSITGISDSYGIVLRDEKGNTWRGFVE
ncbi:MAG: hypothetical protein HYX27_02220 [Acidobacteria bacterium]|nr:hypothetical protein [Acidobacteriota bacterium]